MPAVDERYASAVLLGKYLPKDRHHLDDGLINPDGGVLLLAGADKGLGILTR